MFSIIISFLPSFIGVPIRRLIGQKIGKNTIIKFGAVIISRNVNIGNNVIIGSFVYIRSKNITINDNVRINPITLIQVCDLEIMSYSRISSFVIIHGDHKSNSKFQLGKHSSIFPFTWVDNTRNVFIGNQVGIGGHSLLFTHGSWSNYLKGASVVYDDIHIEDNVWLAWRVFLMPGVKIGENSIVSANSTVYKSVPKNSIVSGFPARIVSDKAYIELDDFQTKERWKYIIMNFCNDSGYHFEELIQSRMKINDIHVSCLSTINENNDDIFYIIDKKNLQYIEFYNTFREKPVLFDLINMVSYNIDKIYIAKELHGYLRNYGIRSDVI